jgi:ribose transport system permease protein
MNRLVGVGCLVTVLYGVLMASDENARSLGNLQNLLQRVGFFGIMTLGAGVLIVSGGIDLSIGSVVGLSAVSFGLLLEAKVPAGLAFALIVLGSAGLGLIHGLLVTVLRLQPFLVTLCGLFVYRGLARYITGTEKASSRDISLAGLDVSGVRWLTESFLGVRMEFWLLLLIAAALAVFLHRSVYGRYLYAIGHNEAAARYAGIRTERYKIVAYVLCATLAGLAGVLSLLDVNSASPSNTGQVYELYAITGAVLGGCSLRGGEGSIAGMLLGTAVLPLLRNLCLFYEIKSELDYTVIGVALLGGTIVDELLKRRRT